MKPAISYFCTLVAIAIFCSASFAASPEQSKVVEVPFNYEQGHIYLSVKLNGLGTIYRMMLNTGVARSVFSNGVAKQAGLKTTVSNPEAADYDKNYSLQATVRIMEIGDLKYANLDVAVIASEGVSAVLGNDFLKHYATQIDFRKQVVRFYEKSPFAKGATSTEGTVILPMKFDSREHVPIIEDVSVNGKKIKASLDTGFGGTLALTPDAVKYLGLKSEKESKSKVESRQLDELMVGTLKIAAPPAFLYSKGSGLDKSLSTLGGIIGNGMMENYTVTFDYQNKIVVFQ